MLMSEAYSLLCLYLLGARDVSDESAHTQVAPTDSFKESPPASTLGDCPRQAIGTMDSYLLVVSGVSIFIPFFLPLCLYPIVCLSLYCPLSQLSYYPRSSLVLDPETSSQMDREYSSTSCCT